MTYLLTKTYGPQDFYVATGGYGTRALQREWIRRGYFNAPIPEPRAGKPREFPRLAIMEATLIAEASRRRLSVSMMSAAVHARYMLAAEETGVTEKLQGKGELWTPKDVKRISAALPEFTDTSGPLEENAYWLIYYPVGSSNTELVPPENIDMSENVAVRVFRTIKHFEPTPLSPVSFLLNITSIFGRMEERLQMPEKDKASLWSGSEKQ